MNAQKEHQLARQNIPHNHLGLLGCRDGVVDVGMDGGKGTEQKRG